MSKNSAHLQNLLSHESSVLWVKKLREILESSDLKEKSESPQSCTINFALEQSKRRLENTKSLGKETFGITELIEVLEKLDKSMEITFYLITNSDFLGTCYVLKNSVLGCEFVRKTGSISMPGLWVDGKRIC
jgi:hypothetical protein